MFWNQTNIAMGGGGILAVECSSLQAGGIFQHKTHLSQRVLSRIVVARRVEEFLVTDLQLCHLFIRAAKQRNKEREPSAKLPS